jgi:AcrR family transcriptional regulator
MPSAARPTTGVIDEMVQQPFTRRASYGPSSPVVGSRGARTRQQIVDAALRCFTELGFHATSVELIAAHADTSRATLYQYFESKDEIFIELMSESGTALLRVARRLGPLGPTAEGFDNLHWWLGEYLWVFEKYAPMFIEWSHVNTPKAALRPRLAGFVDVHTDRFVRAMEAHGPYRHGDPTVMAIMALAITNRANFTTHVYDTGVSDARALDGLAIGLQLSLFPDTPHEVLDAGPSSRDADEIPATRVGRRPERARLPQGGHSRARSPLDGLSEHSAATARRLLDAAGRVFADIGYESANVDRIVTEAGVARGTFYRYFSEKLELLVELAEECSAAMLDPMQRLAALQPDGDGTALREILRDHRAIHRRYGGVLKAWAEGASVDPRALAPAGDVIDALTTAVATLFGPRRSYALGRTATSIMLSASLEHFPNEGVGSKYEPDDDQLIEAQAAFVERVVFPR